MTGLLIGFVFIVLPLTALVMWGFYSMLGTTTRNLDEAAANRARVQGEAIAREAARLDAVASPFSAQPVTPPTGAERTLDEIRAELAGAIEAKRKADGRIARHHAEMDQHER